MAEALQFGDAELIVPGWVVYLITRIQDLAFFTRGALGEEPGLRGFALPRLQESQSPFRASVIIGIVLWRQSRGQKKAAAAG